MKILIILTTWKGGVGSVVKNIKKVLQKKGHKVDVISRKEDLMVGFAKSIPKIRKIIKKEEKNYDIIYTQDWSIAFPLMYPFEILKKKHFCCFHGNQLAKTRILQNRIGKKLGKRLIVVGDSLLKRFPKANKVYNGVDLENFKPLHKKREYLGWIKKGTEIINENDLKKISKKVEMPLIIAEKIPFEKMNEFYNKCEAFVSIPPKSAGFNLCWIEAMAAGVPLIVGNNEGVGSKIPIEKLKSIKELEKILTKKSAKNQRDWLKKSKFLWKKHVDKLCVLWNKCILE